MITAFMNGYCTFSFSMTELQIKPQRKLQDGSSLIASSQRASENFTIDGIFAFSKC